MQSEQSRIKTSKLLQQNAKNWDEGGKRRKTLSGLRWGQGERGVMESKNILQISHPIWVGKKQSGQFMLWENAFVFYFQTLLKKWVWL